MAALRRFLAEDYENLIIVDFVCRGVNSPKAFLKYIASIEQRVGSKVIYIKAKSKELGWRQLATKFIFENGKTIFETKDNNLFTRGYLTTNVFCRPSCYMCKFKGFPRIADISIADFWGIENVEKSLDNDLGTSMVLLNSKKGETFFEFIKPKIESKQVLFETILPGNPVLISPLGPPKVNREIFFKELESSSFDEIALKYFPFKKNDVNVIKQIIKSLYNCTKELKKTSRFHLKPLLQFIKYNFFTKAVRADWKSLNLLYTTPNSIIEIHKNSKILLNGPFYLGIKKFFKSKLESRLLVEDSAKLEVNGTFGFGYGCDIEIFKNAELILNGSKYLNASGSNIGMTVICADRIEIGFDVQIGRNVTIRDNNGGHYIGCQGYKNSRPIIIGDRVWLGEGCTIMPGVKIGEGAIVGAKSLVISNVPAHSIVSGNPAKVVDVDVLWKY
jgi:acetyltransferase-like isoleucine patch superfamily enzyme